MHGLLAKEATHLVNTTALASYHNWILYLDCYFYCYKTIFKDKKADL